MSSQNIHTITLNYNINWLIYYCRTKMHFVGLKMQFCRTKNVRLNIQNVGLNWFLSD
jgi:hypothetical protein